MTPTTIKTTSGEYLPIEMHKVRTVQKLNLLPVEDRLRAVEGAGFNTFLLQNRDVFLDMLTDSGTNAMSDQQVAAMMVADDAYAGSESFTRLQEAIEEVFNMNYFLPVHQGRAAEHIISQVFVTKDTVVPMNSTSPRPRRTSNWPGAPSANCSLRKRSRSSRTRRSKATSTSANCRT